MKLKHLLPFLIFVLIPETAADTIPVIHGYEHPTEQSTLSPEKKTTWQLLDHHPFPPDKKHHLTNCSDCPHVYRKWLHNEDKLKRASYFCGFDFLSVRFTQSFSDTTFKSTITVYTHSTGPGYRLVVDSVVTTIRNSDSATRTSTHLPAKPHTPHLSLPATTPVQKNFTRYINSIIKTASGFRAHCAVSSEGNAAWTFDLQHCSFIIHNGEVLRSRNSEQQHSSGLVAGVAYRLETWGNTVTGLPPHTREHATRPELTISSVNDSQSIILADITAKSLYGLSSCILSCGSHSDTITLNAAASWNNRVAVNAHPDDTLLTVSVTDIHGNSIQKSSPVFIKQHNRAVTRNRQRTLDLYKKESVQHNPLLYGTWLISQFSGNPVSFIAKKTLDHSAKKRIAAMRDFSAAPPADTLVFPLSGNMHNSRITSTAGRYTIPLFADTIHFNGTRISKIVNPRRRGSLEDRSFVNVTLQAPFTQGKHPLHWLIDTIATPTSEINSPALLLCTSATIRTHDVTLHNIPHILDNISKRAIFTLCHFADSLHEDTLTITYRIRYTDNTSSLLYQQFDISPAGIVTPYGCQPSEIKALPSVFTDISGATGLIIHVTLAGKKDIYRIDTFMHSLRENRITGWGAASLPG